MGPPPGGGVIELSAGVIATVCTIVLVAGAVQAITGFGFALVAVPLLTFEIGPAPAVAVAITIGVALAAGVAVGERGHVAGADLAVLAGTGLLGIPLGLLVLTRVDAQPLTVVVAVVLLASTIAIWRGWTMPTGAVTRAATGFISGVLLTSTSFNGPPLVIFLQARELPARTVRATLAVCFLLQELVAVVLLLAVDAADATTVAVSALSLPALAIGWLIGNRAFARLDRAAFRRGVLIMLGLTAVVALVRAVVG